MVLANIFGIGTDALAIILGIYAIAAIQIIAALRVGNKSMKEIIRGDDADATGVN